MPAGLVPVAAAPALTSVVLYALSILTIMMKLPILPCAEKLES